MNRELSDYNILYTPSLQKDSLLHFSSNPDSTLYMHAEGIAQLRVGTRLYNSQSQESLLVIGKHIEHTDTPLAHYTVTCKALTPLSEGQDIYTIGYKGYSLAWITLSDSGSLGKRKDESGPLIGSLLQQHLDISVERGFILPDDPLRLEHLLLDLALFQGFHFIFTTGGTGLAPRDTTPEVMEKILHRSLYGFEIAMMQESMKHVSTAILSRAKAGTIAQSILINVPGSPKAIAQNLNPLLPALQHAIDKLSGDPSDCAGIFALHS